jgi:hypothetical protein
MALYEHFPYPQRSSGSPQGLYLGFLQSGTAPLPSVASIDTSGFFIGHGRELCGQAINITECCFHCMDILISSEDYDDLSESAIKLAHLRSLHIVGHSTGLVVLGTINAPVLESFSCHFQPMATNLDIEHPLSFLDNTPMTKITVHEHWLSRLEFRAMQNLRELHINKWYCPLKSLRSFCSDAYYGHRRPAFPQLETLIISLRKGDPNLKFHDDILLDMIASRRNSGINVAQIKSVTFVNSRTRLSHESHQRLEKLQRGGLEVAFLESAKVDLEVPQVWNGRAQELRCLEFVQ